MRAPVWIGLLAGLWLAFLAPLVVRAETSQVEWLEPKGLGIADLVGLVPESHLRGAIVSYLPDGGLLLYKAGRREGNTVILRATVVPQYGDGLTLMSCLGLRPFDDHWGIAAPESTVRIFSNGADITRRINYLSYHPAGLTQPALGAVNQPRYPIVYAAPRIFRNDGSLELPANMGCLIEIEGRHTNMEAEFRIVQPQVIQVETLGSQSFRFRSYSGPGDAGALSPLQSQLQGLLGNRHDKHALDAPEGADYVLFNFPPTPVGMYVYRDRDANVRLPSTGTYRLSTNGVTLSVDHTVAMGLPLDGQWQDRDQAGGDYLRKLPRVSMLSAPEYFVPPGVEFDPCMVEGNCSRALLEEIDDARYTATVYYYRISRKSEDLHRIALRATGPNWDAGSASASAVLASATPAGASASETATFPTKVYLPLLETVEQPPLPEDQSGCPCGWFTGDGRMVDFIPAPD